MKTIRRSLEVKHAINKLPSVAAMTSLAIAISASGSLAALAADKTICNPGNGTTGEHRGTWYSFYEGSSQNDVSNCDVKMRVYDESGFHFRIDFDQNQTWSEDVVGGVGWSSGSDRRKIGYNIGQLDSNGNDSKLIAGIYGWTCGSGNRSRYPNTQAQEYYIVDSWVGGSFVPWDEVAGAPAKPIQKNGIDVEVSSNGGKYKVYKLKRNGPQYCGNGSSREFYQYWSVRTSKLATGSNREIDFANHDNTWDNYGFRSNKVRNGYQILVGEAFGHANYRHKGSIDASVWER